MAGGLQLSFKGSEGKLQHPNRLRARENGNTDSLPHFISIIIIFIYDQAPLGTNIEYRIDGRHFNLSGLCWRIKMIMIIDHQYTEHYAIVVHIKDGLQTTLTCFCSAYQSLRLSLNVNKTKMLDQPAPGQQIPPPVILNGQENSEDLTYLGSHLSQKATTDEAHATQDQYNY